MTIIVSSLLVIVLVGIAWPVRQRSARRLEQRPADGDVTGWKTVAAETSTLVVVWAMLTLAAVTAANVVAQLAWLAGGALLGVIAGVATLLIVAAFPVLRFVAVVRCRLRTGDYVARLARNSRRSPYPPQVIPT